jgi:hypothetical protein
MLPRGQLGTIDELYAPEYVNHDPCNPGQGTGPEGFKQRVAVDRSVLHGFDLRIEQQIAEGDLVETHWSLRGTHGGPLEGTPDRQAGVGGRPAPQPHCGMAGSLRSGSNGTPWACSAWRDPGEIRYCRSTTRRQPGDRRGSVTGSAMPTDLKQVAGSSARNPGGHDELRAVGGAWRPLLSAGLVVDGGTVDD